MYGLSFLGGFLFCVIIHTFGLSLDQYRQVKHLNKKNMKSTMRIAVDFQKSNEPILEIVLDHESSDIRDQLLKSFCQSLGGGSNILKMEFDNTAALLVPTRSRYVIRAIPAHRNIIELEHPELEKLYERIPPSRNSNPSPEE